MKNTTAIAESAIEATIGYAKYHDTKQEYQTAIESATIEDMRIYAEMIDIEATDEELAQALEIYKGESATERMMDAYRDEDIAIEATATETIGTIATNMLYGNADDVQTIIAQAEEALQNGDPTEAYRLACLANKTYTGMSSMVEWQISSILCKSAKAVEACR